VLRVGEKVSLLARNYELLTRPVRDTLVIMPPLSISLEEIKLIVTALTGALEDYGNHAGNEASTMHKISP